MKRWLAHYDSDVAPTLAPYPDKTLLDYLGELARDQGDTPALLFKGASMSYGALEPQSNAFAAAPGALGVRPATGWRSSFPTARSSWWRSSASGKRAAWSCR